MDVLLCLVCKGDNSTCFLCKNGSYQRMIRENLGGRPRCVRGDVNACFCKGGGKCPLCTSIDAQCLKGGQCPWHITSYKCCNTCSRCTECVLNLHKSNGLPHSKTPIKSDKLTRYVTIRLTTKSSRKRQTVINFELLKNSQGITLYNLANDLTKAVICDHLDKYGLLDKSKVNPPPNYSRRMKYVRRDAPPVLRTSNRPAGHKQEYITCPIKMCEDRTRMCRCQCLICFGVAKDCKCCKVCCNIEDKCTCCKVCGNKEGECTCSVIEFLSLWSL
jgi:hypothetical protein